MYRPETQLQKDKEMMSFQVNKPQEEEKFFGGRGKKGRGGEQRKGQTGGGASEEIDLNE